MLIAGVDEVGRGPWAGPFVVACCILPKQLQKIVKDSKVLSPKKREEIYNILLKESTYGIGMASNFEIDSFGLRKAFELSIKRAIQNMPVKCSFLLIDGKGKLDLPIPYKMIVDGDAKIPSISAASIIAKVWRDKFMQHLSLIYPFYKFEKHKGYGTKEHYELIKQYGICEIHRKSFKPIKILLQEQSGKPKLLLHACCAPCATSVIEKLKEKFEISVYFFNPNIQPKKEYEKRLQEIKTLCNHHQIELIIPSYEPKKWFKIIKPLKNLGEGSKRCYNCYAYRLYHTALSALQNGFDCFATTLSVGPLKNYSYISKIGKTLESLGVNFVDEDFKKQNGFKRSCELSKEFNFYRQTFCGCVYSYYESVNRTAFKKTI